MFTKVIETSKVKESLHLVEQAENIVIVSHVSPDGDALGSSLGLQHLLLSLHKEVNVIVPNAFASFLRWMPGAKDIIIYEKYAEFAQKLIDNADLIFCLDFNDIKRIDRLGDAVGASSVKKVMVDHHLHPSNLCDVVISHPLISSTAELIFRLICRWGCFDKISHDGATCIYTGMMTDTGGFSYNSNQEDIYFIIRKLLSKGIDKDAIYRKVFNNYSENRLRLMGYVLYEKMKIYTPLHAALITLEDEELTKFGYVKGDTEGFVNIPLSVEGVKFAVFLREDKEKEMIKISLRSVGTFPCNQVAAQYFNGGGHLNASGGEFYGTMSEAIAAFEQALATFKPQLTAKE